MKLDHHSDNPRLQLAKVKDYKQNDLKKLRELKMPQLETTQVIQR